MQTGCGGMVLVLLWITDSVTPIDREFVTN